MLVLPSSWLEELPSWRRKREGLSRLPQANGREPQHLRQELGASREKEALRNKRRIKDSLGLVIEGSPIQSLI